jgi:vacuolar-type H+-ATPase subunit C/Vma6
MTRYWGDLVARVAGLRARLLRREQLARFGSAGELAALARSLNDSGRLPVPVESPHTPARMEKAFRRAAAEPMEAVRRWAGSRSDALTPFFDDEDRRSIRALLRGAAAGAPASDRLAGLIPTSALPNRALYELASQATVAAVLRTLQAWKHPLTLDIDPASARARPDLLAFETAIRRAAAARAFTSLRRTPWGSSARRLITNYVRRTVDIENVWVAIDIAGTAEAKPDERFVEGGRYLTRDAFTTIATSASRDDAISRAISALGSAPIAPLVTVAEERMEVEALSFELAGARRESRSDAAGPARVVEFFLRLRAESRDLRALLWHATLGAPLFPDALLTPP